MVFVSFQMSLKVINMKEKMQNYGGLLYFDYNFFNGSQVSIITRNRQIVQKKRLVTNTYGAKVLEISEN